MINIKFLIKEFPTDLSKSYALDAYTEGVLAISVDGEIAFEEDGILLVELSESLEPWVAQMDSGLGGMSDFYYASMDFEEEPILAFRYSASEKFYRIESVWSANEAFVKRAELIDACKIFISELNSAVQKRVEVSRKGKP